MSEGDWLIADRQLAGKGRLGRPWNDGAGNFMGSTAVQLGPTDPPPGTLALVAALALAEALSPLIPPPRRLMLKWPNDVLVGDAKLAGILLERIGEAVIVGIGVNLAQAPSVEGRVTAALSAFGPPPDRDLFAEALAESFATECERWRNYGLDPIVRRWILLAHPVGTPLAVGEPGGTSVAGTFAGLAGDGALQLRLADGTTHLIHAGDVNLA
ncbi:biotin--[acetyl-CoA-carboxylase] ligase [Parablastomonas sp. CN1-191]|uniref:biotin--[acetyl-CoA-carboxylase] ligase n=1 Tax=Parablastomonas sp. CN1-191 TaxID=3400908 RepID=UPI003BF78C7A